MTIQKPTEEGEMTDEKAEIRRAWRGIRLACLGMVILCAPAISASGGDAYVGLVGTLLMAAGMSIVLFGWVPAGVRDGARWIRSTVQKSQE